MSGYYTKQTLLIGVGLLIGCWFVRTPSVHARTWSWLCGSDYRVVYENHKQPVNRIVGCLVVCGMTGGCGYLVGRLTGKPKG